MLRVVFALLLLANLAFFAWTQGWLDTVVGVRSIGDREPERLLRQVRPESIRIVSPASAASAAGAASAASAAAAAGAASNPAATAGAVGGLGSAGVPLVAAAGTTSSATAFAPACLEAGPFADADLAAAQAAVQLAVPGNGWVAVTTEAPGAWLVYMGRYASVQALNKKADELKRRRLPFEVVRNRPSLEPGLSLGRFDNRTRAMGALDNLTQQGVRTARVVELASATVTHRLRNPQVDTALAARFATAPQSVLGKGLLPCATRPPGA